MTSYLQFSSNYSRATGGELGFLLDFNHKMHQVEYKLKKSTQSAPHLLQIRNLYNVLLKDSQRSTAHLVPLSLADSCFGCWYSSLLFWSTPYFYKEAV